MKSRTLLFRVLAVAFLAAVAAVCLVVGRGHAVYLDNKTLEYDGQTCKAPYRIDVYVDGERAARLAARERGQSSCIGQTFHMTLHITENKGEEPEVREVSVPIPYAMDGVVINLPGYLSGLPEEAWLAEFVPIPSAEDEEEPDIGEDGLPTEEDMGLADI